MKRFLAVAASVVMVCVAIVIRSGIDSSESGTKESSGPITIACVTELEAQCTALSNVTVRVEDAAITAKAIAAGTANIDGWITFDPWPEMTNQLAQEQVTGDSERIAASPLVIAMVQERADAFAPTCGGPVNWRCLGDAIGKQWTEVGGQSVWGTVKAGVPLISSASGLLLLGNAASGYFGRTDFATNDFDDGFIVWRSKVTTTSASFADFILKFPAAFSAVGATKVEIINGSGTRPVETITPTPAASAVVVLAPVRGGRLSGLASDLKKLLGEAGWSADGLDAPTGLPNSGVLLALSGLTR